MEREENKDLETENEIKKMEDSDEKPMCSKETELDPELDVSSERFNPLRALNTDNFKVSECKPKVIYQNLAALETALKTKGLWKLNKALPIPTRKGESSIVLAPDESERRFQPHQMAIRRTKDELEIRTHRHNRNIFTFMENSQGPLEQLQKWRNSEDRIVVLVRNEHGVRGTIEGELLAYDKHWNLALRNVLETWTRRKYKYGDNKLCGLPGAEDCSQRLKDLGIKLPEIEVKSLNRKNVQIKRKIPQLLLRGEQVVLVKRLKNPQSKNEIRDINT